MVFAGLQEYRVPTQRSLTFLYPILERSFIDSLCASRAHSYQLSYNMSLSIGAVQTVPPKKEHTHIVNTNFVIDTYCNV